MCDAAQLLGRTLSPTGVVEVDDALNVVAADDVLTSKCSSRPPDAWFPGTTSPPVAVRPSEPGSHQKSLPETGMTSFLLTGESTLLFWYLISWGATLPTNDPSWNQALTSGERRRCERVHVLPLLLSLRRSPGFSMPMFFPSYSPRCICDHSTDGCPDWHPNFR